MFVFSVLRRKVTQEKYDEGYASKSEKNVMYEGTTKATKSDKDRKSPTTSVGDVSLLSK